VRFICSSDQVADGFTKPLATRQLATFKNNLNLATQLWLMGGVKILEHLARPTLPFEQSNTNNHNVINSDKLYTLYKINSIQNHHIRQQVHHQHVNDWLSLLSKSTNIESDRTCVRYPLDHPFASNINQHIISNLASEDQ